MGEVIELKRNKPFTLKEAQTLLPIVKRITEEAVTQVEQLERRRPDSEQELNRIVNRWSDKIFKLGAEPKGLWLVDFDNGAGCYCWRHPEDEVCFYHTYEGGFNARQPIL